MTPEQAQANMQKAKSTLEAYTGALPSQIKAEIENAWTPSLKTATGEVEKVMGQALPNYWNIPFMGLSGGTTAADLGVSQKLAAMGQGLGDWGGRIQGATRVADYLGGQMRDLYGQAVDASRFGYQTANDEYQRAFNEWQVLEQMREAARARAAAAAQFSGFGGGGGSAERSPFSLGLSEEGKDYGEMTQEERFAPATQQYGSNFGNIMNSMAAEIKKTPNYLERTKIYQKYAGMMPGMTPQQTMILQSIASGKALY